MANILDNAVMISLSFQRFGNSRQIKANEGDNGVQTREIDPRVIRISKTLIDSPELTAISKYDLNVIRDYVMSQSVPSFQVPGVYFVSKSIVKDVDAKLREFVTERQNLIEKAVQTLQTRIAETAVLLGPAYNPADYPSEDDFRASYDVSWQFLDLSVPESLKDIDANLYESEKNKAASRVANAQEQIKGLLRQQFAEHIGRFIDRLEGKREGGKIKIFRDSMVANLNAFVGSFDARNLTGDDELAALVAEIRSVMDGVTADDLRDTEGFVRENVLAACKQVQDALAAMGVVVATEAANGETLEKAAA